MYLYRLVLEVVGEVVQDSKEEVLLQRQYRPTTATLARAYAMRAHKDRDAPGVIAGNFTLYNNEMHVLVDPSSTHSYVCIEQLSDKLP